MARLTRILFRCRFHWAGIAAIVNRQGILSRSESWGRLGALSGRLGRLWRHLGALLGRLGALSEASWAVLERTLGPIGPTWSVGKPKRREIENPSKTYEKTMILPLRDLLGGLLEASWDVWEASWRVWGSFWGNLGPSWVVLAVSKRDFWRSGDVFGRS